MKQKIQEEINRETLSDREKAILCYRYGLVDKEHTKQETAKLFGVSKERIRQIEVNALRKINI